MTSKSKELFFGVFFMFRLAEGGKTRTNKRGNRGEQNGKKKQEIIWPKKRSCKMTDFSLLPVIPPEMHRMVSPWRKWVWNLGMIWRKIKWCKSGVNKQKSAVKIIENYWKQYASHINMQKKVGCYIFLHKKRNCEIFIFKCAKIMKIVRIHILIQKNFHVIRLKNEA